MLEYGNDQKAKEINLNMNTLTLPNNTTRITGRMN